MLSQSVVLCILPLQELEKLKWEKQRDERMRQQIKENRWTMVISSMKKIANWTLRILPPPPTHTHLQKKTNNNKKTNKQWNGQVVEAGHHIVKRVRSRNKGTGYATYHMVAKRKQQIYVVQTPHCVLEAAHKFSTPLLRCHSSTMPP